MTMTMTMTPFQNEGHVVMGKKTDPKTRKPGGDRASIV